MLILFYITEVFCRFQLTVFSKNTIKRMLKMLIYKHFYSGVSVFYKMFFFTENSKHCLSRSIRTRYE